MWNVLLLVIAYIKYDAWHTAEVGQFIGAVRAICLQIALPTSRNALSVVTCELICFTALSCCWNTHTHPHTHPVTLAALSRISPRGLFLYRDTSEPRTSSRQKRPNPLRTMASNSTILSQFKKTFKSRTLTPTTSLNFSLRLLQRAGYTKSWI